MPHIIMTVSIVSYNSKHVLGKCIRSVLDTTQGMDIEIIVVDNCSEDGTAEMVKIHFPNIRLIQNRENVGFGKAHNQSFKLSKGRYFLILNPDTVIFPNALQRVVAFMDGNRDAGVVGCRTYWDNDKRFMFPDLRIHTLKTALLQFTPFCQFFPHSTISKWYWKTAYRVWNADIPLQVEAVPGGFMLVQREAFESVGLFDEQFFLFFEEHDLFRRMKKKGWGIYYVPGAEIQHYFEESFRNSSVDTGSIFMRSALYYYRKHYTVLGYFLIKALFAFNKFIFSRGTYRDTYSVVHPADDRLLINWPPRKRAQRYLVELSYWQTFCDRGGMYVDRESISLKSEILDRLPGRTGFIRVTPVFADNSTGSVIKVVKITA